MSLWPTVLLERTLRGRWLSPAPVVEVLGFGIDSRLIEPGQVFVALPGERVDGRQFLQQACAQGSPVAIVGPGAVDIPDDMGVLQVENPRLSLMRLARAWRDEHEGVKVIAVTGSCGKTTTVRMIDAVLSEQLVGSASARSFNNDIGLPLTLLNVRPGDAYVVCELGTSSHGEIERLAWVCRPDVAVITNIGRAHLEKLGSVEGVAQEKGQLLRHMRRHGLAVVPCGAPGLDLALTEVASGRVVRVGVEDEAEVCVQRVETLDGCTRFEIRGAGMFEVPMQGAHNALNGAVAFAVGRRTGVSDEAIKRGLGRTPSVEMRLEVLKIGSLTVINDAYNANPDSVIAAINTLEAMDVPGRRVIVLGDMLELGEHAYHEHEAVGALIERESSAEIVIGVGQHAGSISKGVTHRFSSADSESIEQIADLIRPGDTVLVKGSRGLRLERVVEELGRRNTGLNMSVDRQLR